MKGTAYWSGEGSFDATWSIIDVYYFHFSAFQVELKWVVVDFSDFCSKIEFAEI